MTPEHRIYALWDAWAISWTVAMFWSNRILKRDGRGAELFFRVSFCASFILLFWLSTEPPLLCANAALAVSRCDALDISCTNGSRTVVHLVGAHSPRSSLVELGGEEGRSPTSSTQGLTDPIYSRLLLAALATAIQKGTSFALLGIAVLTLAYCVKARREERFLRTELGEGVYDAYARKTPMLVPFV